MVLTRRRALYFASYFTMGAAAVFGAVVIVSLADEFGIGLFSDIAGFFKGDPLGISIFFVLGALTFAMFVIMVLRVREGQMLRRVRYGLLDLLSMNRRLAGRRTEISDLAASIGADVHEVELCLEVLIRRGEVRGRIDQRRGTYLHNGVTRRGKMASKISSPFERETYRVKSDRRSTK
jgi:hypothetical protein